MKERSSTKFQLTICFCLIGLLIFSITACGQQTHIDYGNAKAFESALNDGKDLTDKTVQVKITKLEPNSAFGYNIEAGNHLNFVSKENPNIKKGDVVTLKATKIASALGSWIIRYEKVDNGVIDKKTIKTYKKKATNNSSENTSTATTNVAIDYPNDSDFEAALNAGQDLTGKTVTIKVTKLEPQSAFGYNVEAGQHLNFVSPTNPNVNVGDTINVKVTEIQSIVGSWVISYDRVN